MQYSLPKAIRADPSPDVVPRLLDEIAQPVAKTRQDPEGLQGLSLKALARDHAAICRVLWTRCGARVMKINKPQQ
jgi:hypothetical protein